MKATVVTIPTDAIVDWDSFHQVFRTALGFPEFYGCNMDAWIDCLTSVDDPSSGMTNPSVAPGGLFTLRIDAAADFRRRCPEQYAALLDCAAFVNYRRIEVREPPVLALMLAGNF